jgi:hypothetical protein
MIQRKLVLHRRGDEGLWSQCEHIIPHGFGIPSDYSLLADDVVHVGHQRHRHQTHKSHFSGEEYG